MAPYLVLISHVLHPAVVQGFMPAGLALGYDIVLVTDQALAHNRYFAEHRDALPAEMIECDVFNPLAIIDALNSHAIEPALVFSNSDHLQTTTALVANYFSLAGKPWQRCYQAKNKAAMRQRLKALELPSTPSTLLLPDQPLPTTLSFPLVAKPREGVASMNVKLCRNADELKDYVKLFHRSHPVSPILLESYLEGDLFTLETLGDGTDMVAVGGFDVQLSEPPHFVERQAVWNGTNSLSYREEALAQLEEFGVNFGVCHSEFIATAEGPRLVEINYRSIGDHREFLLDKVLPTGWFKPILQLHESNPLPPLADVHRQAVIRYITAPYEGRVSRQQARFQKEQAGVQWEYRPLKQTGDPIRLTHSNKDYLGVLTAITESEEPLLPRIEELCQSLDWAVDSEFDKEINT